MSLQTESVDAPLLRVPETLIHAIDAPGATDDESEGVPTADPTADLLAASSRQGRLLLRLVASTDTLMQKNDRLAERMDAWEVRARNILSTVEKADRANQTASDEQLYRMAGEAIFFMDVLQNAYEAASASKNANLTRELASALKNGARRLASQGVCEIPCPIGEPPDGRLHESVDTAKAPVGSARYGIVGIVRRGWQIGTHVLRRAQVVTAR